MRKILLRYSPFLLILWTGVIGFLFVLITGNLFKYSFTSLLLGIGILTISSYFFLKMPDKQLFNTSPMRSLIIVMITLEIVLTVLRLKVLSEHGSITNSLSLLLALIGGYIVILSTWILAKKT